MNITRHFGSLILLTVLVVSGCGGGSSSVGSGSGGGSSPNQPPPPSDGKAGSMSRFALVGDFLYAISGDRLKLYNLAVNPEAPTTFANIPMNNQIETLFSANGHLFVGSQTGVHIYENSQPAAPQYVSSFTHVQSCDPVVVSGQYAYVTLRSDNRGWRCRRGENRLDVLDLSNVFNPPVPPSSRAPILVGSYPMQNPKGLGVDNGSLYVCDGIAGMKTYSLTGDGSPDRPWYSSSDTSLNCYDLIPDNTHLVISDNSGLIQVNPTIVDLNQYNERVSHIELETP